jgi:hypothetical protein
MTWVLHGCSKQLPVQVAVTWVFVTVAGRLWQLCAVLDSNTGIGCVVIYVSGAPRGGGGESACQRYMCARL